MTFQPHQAARAQPEREPPLPDCDGVSDCYFSAAGEMAREASIRRDAGGN